MEDSDIEDFDGMNNGTGGPSESSEEEEVQTDTESSLDTMDFADDDWQPEQHLDSQSESDVSMASDSDSDFSTGDGGSVAEDIVLSSESDYDSYMSIMQPWTKILTGILFDVSFL